MFTYISDGKLFVIVENTGRVYRIKLDYTGRYLEIIHEDTLDYQEDVIRHIQSNKAQVVIG